MLNLLGHSLEDLEDPTGPWKGYKQSQKESYTFTMKKAAIIKGLAKQVDFQIDEKTTPKASGKATSSTYCVYLGK